MRPQHKPVVAKLFKNSAFRLGFFLIICTLLMAQFLGSSKASLGEKKGERAPLAQPMPRGESDARVRRWLNLNMPLAGAFALPQSGPESISTYKADCTTPETRFLTGDVVCAKDANFSPQTRAIYWVNPDGVVVQTDPITSGSPTSSRTVTQAGNWKVYLVGFENEARDLARFSVSDPNQTTFDLSVFNSSGSTFLSGGVVSYQILAENSGPDDATTVQLTEQTPNDTTLISSTQDSGPTFTCTPGTGNTVCTIATLPAGTTASFTFFYQISAGATVNEIIFNTVSIQDGTTGTQTPSELHPEDNTWTSENTVTGTGGTNTCSIACPDDITVQADTTQNNQSGAIVHFPTPAGNSECGPIIVDHCNDCFFPEGTTVVTASAATGESCSFRVIVTASTGAATISCPANITASADNTCSATVSVGTPTATGNNLTVFGVRSDGQPMYNCDCFNDGNPDDNCDVHGACTRRTDAPFPAGVTTITWTAISHDIPGPYPDPATEEAHRTGVASCMQTITVNDVTPPVINATDSSASADANCQAAVPDYSSTVTDNCACASSDTSQGCTDHSRITYTQTPAAGTLVGLGPHTVHITANDGSSNNGGAGNTSTKDVTFTVNDTTPPTITCPANITTGNDPGSCSATVNPGTATASDNCGNPTVTGTRSDNQSLSSPYPTGTTTITWTATDSSGNSSSCTQTVTVNDTQAPTISCPANITKNNDPGVCGAVVTYTTPVGSDNCPGATTAQKAGLPSGSTFPVGTTTNTFEVTDSSGNKTSCSFTVTVNDTELPQITCPSSFTLEPTCPSGAVGTYTAPVGTDNCPGATTTRTAGLASGSVFPIGTTTVTYSVTDAHGNGPVSCSFTVTVKTPAAVIQDLINRVQALMDSGVLSQSNGNGLQNKLHAALDAVNSGNTGKACSDLDSFIDKVQGYIQHGTLTSAQGQPLIDSAVHAQDGLGCKSVSCT